MDSSSKPIEPAEWFEKIRKSLDASRPYLKYLPQFEPIGDFFNRFLPEIQIEQSLMEFPEGVSQKTRCTKLATFLIPKEEGKHISGGPLFVTETTIFLSQEGRLLYHELKYERVVRDTVRVGMDLRQIVHFDQIAVICRFSLLGESELLDLLIKDNTLGLSITEKLRTLVRDSVREREERLQKLRRLGENLDEIRYETDRR